MSKSGNDELDAIVEDALDGYRWAAANGNMMWQNAASGDKWSEARVTRWWDIQSAYEKVFNATTVEDARQLLDNARRFEAQCGAKRKYTNLAFAQEAVAEAKRNGGQREQSLQAYSCPFCGAAHLGHRK